MAMNIGTIAERAGLPRKTIRYYESIGLMASDRRANGYRTFTDIDMHTLHFIKQARSLGFSVEEVRDLLDLWRNKNRLSSAVKAVARQHLEALDRRTAELRAMRRTLADLVVRCRGDDRPDCPILHDLGNRAMSDARTRDDARTPLRGVRISQSLG
jgi:MerR family transcriptional regulator, copper efflux regulator